MKKPKQKVPKNEVEDSDTSTQDEAEADLSSVDEKEQKRVNRLLKKCTEESDSDSDTAYIPKKYYY